jgi:hypothetical protein
LGHSFAVTSVSDHQSSSSRSDAPTSGFFNNQKNDKQPAFLFSNTTTTHYHIHHHHHGAPQQDLSSQMIWPSILQPQQRPQPPHVPLQQQQALVRSKVTQHETAAVVHQQKQDSSLICSLIPDEQKFQELLRERRFEKREFEEF